MESFMNMGFRVLTTKDVTKLKGMDKIQEDTALDLEDAAQPLPTMVYPETVLPELQQPVPAPTAEELQKQIEALNMKAQEEYQTEQQAKTEVLQKANEALLEDVKTFPVVSLQPLQTQMQSSQNQIQTQQTQQQLQPSIRVPVPVNLEGTIVATTEKGEPIIAVDTTEQALKENGLVQPRDSTASLEPQMMMPQQQFTPRRIRRQPSRPQQGGYGFYGQQPFYAPQPSQPSQFTREEQQEAPTNSSSNAQVRVTVEKLG
jgi:hypothetical protein